MDNELVREIDQRICNIMGVEVANSELVQAHWYDVGEEYISHVDYCETNTAPHNKYCVENGKPVWSFMIYLNRTAEGGQTHFPELDIMIQPNTGNAVVWNNYDKQGELN